MADITALNELLAWCETAPRWHAALTEAIADVERLDKVERDFIDLLFVGKWEAVTGDGRVGVGLTSRAAIDEVPE